MSTEAAGPTRPRSRLAGKAAAFIVLVVVAVLAWRFGGAPPPRVQWAFERAREAGGERLAADTPLLTGDRLSLVVRAEEPIHVYVANEDASGAVAALFPFAQLDRANPLPAGDEVRLPGTLAGQPFSWQVTSTSGREHFLLVASREHLADVEAELGRAGSQAPAVAAAAEPGAGLAALERRLFPTGVPRDVRVERRHFDVGARAQASP